LVEYVRKHLPSANGTAKSSEKPAKRTGKDGRQYTAKKPRKAKPAKEREAGDEDDKPKASKTTDKPKPGSPLFDWSDFNKHFGVVARGPDAIAAAYKGEKDGTEYAASMRSLETLAKTFKGWQKRLGKEKT
jgi:hypothetical protein